MCGSCGCESEADEPAGPFTPGAGPVGYQVRRADHRTGERSYVLVDMATGHVYERVDRWLRGKSENTQYAYAYHVKDHLEWLRSIDKSEEDMTLADLKRYMGLCGATVAGPLGTPWLDEALSDNTLGSRAAALKSYYVHWTQHERINPELKEQLSATKLPSVRQREVSAAGNGLTSVPVNPLSSRTGGSRRHPKLPQDNAVALLFQAAETARDRMIVAWLDDSGMRIGEYCGLHFTDLHLTVGHECGERRERHAHVIKRWTNPNRALAKRSVEPPRDGVVRGGRCVAVSPRMLETYHEYLTTEYYELRAAAQHDLVLVHLASSRTPGAPLSPHGVRQMLYRLADRVGLDKVNPHAFRHLWSTNMLEETHGDSVLVAQEGGWSSARTVEETYGHLAGAPATMRAVEAVHRRNAERAAGRAADG
jgi:integrase